MHKFDLFCRNILKLLLERVYVTIHDRDVVSIFSFLNEFTQKKNCEFVQQKCYEENTFYVH